MHSTHRMSYRARRHRRGFSLTLHNKWDCQLEAWQRSFMASCHCHWTPTMLIVWGLYSRMYTLFLRQSVPSARSIFNPPNTEVAQLSKTKRGGEQPKTALWLWVHEMTCYLYIRGVRGRIKAKQCWFKFTRELCHEWFHHVHDGHWTAEFATVIWRLHCFTVSFRTWWRSRRIRPQRTHLSQLENSAMGTWPVYKNCYTRLVKKMAWYKILIYVLIVLFLRLTMCFPYWRCTKHAQLSIGTRPIYKKIHV